MMVSNMIRDHDHSPIRSQACSPKLPKEGKAGLGIETTGRPPADQLAVRQAHGTEISDASSRRMTQ